MASPENYTAREDLVDGVGVLRLRDAARRTEVAIAPSIGNNAFEFAVDGRNYLWSPFALGKLGAKPVFFGNPLMAPWANRLDTHSFRANGRRYLLNRELGNYPLDDSGFPVHGLLVNSRAWKVSELAAGPEGAVATCRLEFWRHPDLMAQFPFAHTMAVTHRLKDGVLEVETVLENHALEPMPVSLGYHPFFRLHDAQRESWNTHFPAAEEMPLSATYFPTGTMIPLGLPEPAPFSSLKSVYVLPRLHARADGRAEFWVQGKAERITLVQGPKFPVSVIYAPAGEDYICFEPMTATINALNPPANGRADPVQSVASGGIWRESFWIHHSAGNV